MNAILSEKAKNLISAINYLEANSKGPTTKIREDHLKNVIQVMEISLPLNPLITEKLFVSLVILMANDSVFEPEKELILQILLLIYQKYANLLAFLWISQDVINIAALLLFRSLESIKVCENLLIYLATIFSQDKL